MDILMAGPAESRERDTAPLVTVMTDGTSIFDSFTTTEMG